MDKETAKKIEKIDREKLEHIKRVRKAYDDKVSRIRKERDKNNDKKRDKNKEEIEIHALTNAESLKEFVKYGANKVLDQIRVRSHANVISREEIAKMKKKEGTDMKQATLTILTIIIIGVIAYVVVSNFMSFNEVSEQYRACKMSEGDVSGQLRACQSELDRYRPGAIQVQQASPTTPPGESNTLQG